MKLLSIMVLALIFGASPKRPPIVKVQALLDRYTNSSDTTYVINFWATWCGPCVKELPNFERIHSEYSGNKVKVILVSMDAVSQYKSKLIPFVKRKKIMSEVILLDESRPNEFIDRIEPRWGGSIPATLIVNGAKKKREFLERELSYDQLKIWLERFLNS